MIVVPGSASSGLSRKIADISGCEIANVEKKRFPDGEMYVRIASDVSGKDAVIVQSTTSDEKILEAILLCDATREANARKIVFVAPYFGYARQDKIFKPGEPISARAFARAIQANCDAFLSVDLHANSVINWFTIPAFEISAIPCVANYFRGKNIDILVSPDKGGVERVKRTSELSGIPYVHLDKVRLDGHTVTIKLPDWDFRGKNVAIVDDIISTGGTIKTAAKQMLDAGAKSVSCACTHGLFLGNSGNELAALCNAVIASDTIETKFSSYSVAEEIERALSKVI
ncbi:MAG: ribose-phosphate diphosphokinase [Thermoplasmata archaeon]|nr:ribose-phosphate diphosphokinase [Thermoplasmata archaeon]